jgi:hypothetical protein
MRNWFVGAFLVAFWMVGVGTGATQAQTFVFSAGSPAWTGAPNRNASTSVEWALLAGQSVTKVEIGVYKVTAGPGGMRAEILVNSVNASAPPAINSPFASNLGIATGAGTYCVRATLYYSSGGVAQTPIPIVSADQAL